ncbi:MAG: GerMN domain-containing protein [Nitriliruptoraceae bacterium]
MTRIRLPGVLAIVLALLLAACGGNVTDGGPLAEIDEEPSETDDAPDDAEPGDGTDVSSDADEPAADGSDDGEDREDGDDAATPEETTPVRLYFLAPGGDTPARAGPFLVSVEREVEATEQIAHAAVRALIDGPTDEEESLVAEVSSSVPAETLLLGVTIEDAVATVDLSREFESGGGSLSMFARLAQVVYTLTQFPTVDEVRFALEGDPVTVFSGEGIVLDEPVARDDYHDLLPTVFIDTPAAGAEVELPLNLTGKAAVFEATFQYRVTSEDGTVLAEDFAMSDSGIGWGDIDVAIDLEVEEPTEAVLTVWEFSAQDGSIQAERDTPLTLLP